MPGAKVQTSYTKSGMNHLMSCIGDSHTYNNTLTVLADEFYPEKLCAQLRAQGYGARAVNVGVSGNTTGQMLARVPVMIQWGAPLIGVIYGGTNDAQYNTTVQASPAPTTTTFTVGAGKGANYQPGTYLTVGGTSALIASVATDAITLSAPLAGAPSAGAAVAIDTQTNLVKIGQYLQGKGCSKIIVGGQHYLNYSSGGDTHASPLAANVTLRGLQSAAATALGAGAVYCDFFAYMDNLIQTGQAVQGSFSWHVADSNPHLNGDRTVASGQLAGQTILSNALLATIQAQTGWLTALS